MREALAVNAEDWDSFPEECLEATRAFLRARGLPAEFKPVFGRGVRYWSSTLSTGGKTYELFIYEDAAAYWMNRERWLRVEPTEYPSVEDQIAAFLKALGSSLDAPQT